MQIKIKRDLDGATLSILVPSDFWIPDWIPDWIPEEETSDVWIPEKEKRLLRLSQEILGGGSNGIVKKGTFGSIAVAVKHVSLHFLNMGEDQLKRRQGEEGDDPFLKILQQECQVLTHISHPNCVSLYGFSFTPDWFLIATELCTGEG